MGNGVGKLNLCFAGDAGEISRRRHHDIAVHLSHPLDEGLGHSFFYIKPEVSISKQQNTITATTTMTAATTMFRTISGASISANTFTPLSTAVVDTTFCFDKAASFQSTDSFASIPLQPVPKNSAPAVRSGPIPFSGPGSGPIERGFLSGPMERSYVSGPLETNQYDHILRYKPKSRKFALLRMLKRTLEKSKESKWVNGSGSLRNHNRASSAESAVTNNTNTNSSLADEDECDSDRNVEWAQGKAGEDRIHVVISEENGWDFVGIYDGFNGPDATDFLLNNLYTYVFKELDAIKWNDGLNPAKHADVLRALSVGLKKAEKAYLEIADMMLLENPELALMGSCVLAMLMRGNDVYVMNVGDSRAVLGRKGEMCDAEDFDSFPSLEARQLSVDHSTSMEEEVRRIRSLHWDDASAVTNDRVKGSLKVTRAFGAGFLKQPKWNNALLEMFRIDYVGTSPYITCFPSLYHHRLGPKDKFLILSSDGLYQYFTNEEVVSEVDMFISLFPEGDPAQHLVEEVLFRAAKKAGMDFHDLLDIPQGDRRKYHDDVSIIIISFEGRIWRSSM